MGQHQGRPLTRDDLQPPFAEFVDVISRETLDNFWEAFNEHSAGYALKRNIFLRICGPLFSQPITMPERALCNSVFTLFDTEKNQHIDSLQALAVIALCSIRVAIKERLRFVFRLFDFADQGFLTSVDVLLAMRVMATGLIKVYQQNANNFGSVQLNLPSNGCLAQVCSRAIALISVSQPDTLHKKPTSPASRNSNSDDSDSDSGHIVPQNSIRNQHTPQDVTTIDENFEVDEHAFAQLCWASSDIRAWLVGTLLDLSSCPTPKLWSKQVHDQTSNPFCVSQTDNREWERSMIHLEPSNPQYARKELVVPRVNRPGSRGAAAPAIVSERLPPLNLKLEYVFGYGRYATQLRSFTDSILGGPCIAFAAGNVLVLQRTDDGQQRHLVEHNGHIVGWDISRFCDVAVSVQSGQHGQTGGMGVLWDVRTGSPIRRFSLGISCATDNYVEAIDVKLVVHTSATGISECSVLVLTTRAVAIYVLTLYKTCEMRSCTSWSPTWHSSLPQGQVKCGTFLKPSRSFVLVGDGGFFLLYTQVPGGFLRPTWYCEQGIWFTTALPSHEETESRKQNRRRDSAAAQGEATTAIAAESARILPTGESRIQRAIIVNKVAETFDHTCIIVLDDVNRLVDNTTGISDVVTGSSQGAITLWHGISAVKTVLCHGGQYVRVLLMHSEAQMFVSAGDDGMLCLWTFGLECVSTIDLSLTLGMICDCNVSSLAWPPEAVHIADTNDIPKTRINGDKNVPENSKQPSRKVADSSLIESVYVGTLNGAVHECNLKKGIREAVNSKRTKQSQIRKTRVSGILGTKQQKMGRTSGVASKSRGSVLSDVSARLGQTAIPLVPGFLVQYFDNNNNKNNNSMNNNNNNNNNNKNKPSSEPPTFSFIHRPGTAELFVALPTGSLDVWDATRCEWVATTLLPRTEEHSIAHTAMSVTPFPPIIDASRPPTSSGSRPSTVGTSSRPSTRGTVVSAVQTREALLKSSRVVVAYTLATNENKEGTTYIDLACTQNYLAVFELPLSTYPTEDAFECVASHKIDDMLNTSSELGVHRCKLSPSGNIVALSMNDGSFSLMVLKDGGLRIRLLHVLRPSLSDLKNDIFDIDSYGLVEYMDFSEAEDLIRYNVMPNAEIHISGVISGKQKNSLSEAKDKRWTAEQCVISWEAQPLWDNCHFAKRCEHQPTALRRDLEFSGMLVVGRKDGTVNLCSPDAKRCVGSARGFSSRVSMIDMSSDRVWTGSFKSGCVMQYVLVKSRATPALVNCESAQDLVDIHKETAMLLSRDQDSANFSPAAHSQSVDWFGGFNRVKRGHERIPNKQFYPSLTLFDHPRPLNPKLFNESNNANVAGTAAFQGSGTVWSMLLLNYGVDCGNDIPEMSRSTYSSSNGSIGENGLICGETKDDSSTCSTPLLMMATGEMVGIRMLGKDLTSGNKESIRDIQQHSCSRNIRVHEASVVAIVTDPTCSIVASADWNVHAESQYQRTHGEANVVVWNLESEKVLAKIPLQDGARPLALCFGSRTPYRDTTTTSTNPAYEILAVLTHTSGAEYTQVHVFAWQCGSENAWLCTVPAPAALPQWFEFAPDFTAGRPILGLGNRASMQMLWALEGSSLTQCGAFHPLTAPLMNYVSTDESITSWCWIMAGGSIAGTNAGKLTLLGQGESESLAPGAVIKQAHFGAITCIVRASLGVQMGRQSDLSKSADARKMRAEIANEKCLIVSAGCGENGLIKLWVAGNSSEPLEPLRSIQVGNDPCMKLFVNQSGSRLGYMTWPSIEYGSVDLVKYTSSQLETMLESKQYAGSPVRTTSPTRTSQVSSPTRVQTSRANGTISPSKGPSVGGSPSRKSRATKDKDVEQDRLNIDPLGVWATSMLNLKDNDTIVAVDGHPTLPHIAILTSNGRVMVVDCITSMRVHEGMVPDNTSVSCHTCAWSPDGKLIVVGRQGDLVNVLRIKKAVRDEGQTDENCPTLLEWELEHVVSCGSVECLGVVQALKFTPDSAHVVLAVKQNVIMYFLGIDGNGSIDAADESDDDKNARSNSAKLKGRVAAPVSRYANTDNVEDNDNNTSEYSNNSDDDVSIKFRVFEIQVHQVHLVIGVDVSVDGNFVRVQDDHGKLVVLSTHAHSIVQEMPVTRWLSSTTGNLMNWTQFSFENDEENAKDGLSGEMTDATAHRTEYLARGDISMLDSNCHPIEEKEGKETKDKQTAEGEKKTEKNKDRTRSVVFYVYAEGYVVLSDCVPDDQSTKLNSSSEYRPFISSIAIPGALVGATSLQTQKQLVTFTRDTVRLWGVDKDNFTQRAMTRLQAPRLLAANFLEPAHSQTTQEESLVLLPPAAAAMPLQLKISRVFGCSGVSSSAVAFAVGNQGVILPGPGFLTIQQLGNGEQRHISMGHNSKPQLVSTIAISPSRNLVAMACDEQIDTYSISKEHEQVVNIWDIELDTQVCVLHTGLESHNTQGQHISGTIGMMAWECQESKFAAIHCSTWTLCVWECVSSLCDDSGVSVGMKPRWSDHNAVRLVACVGIGATPFMEWISSSSLSCAGQQTELVMGARGALQVWNQVRDSSACRLAWDALYEEKKTEEKTNNDNDEENDEEIEIAAPHIQVNDIKVILNSHKLVKQEDLHEYVCGAWDESVLISARSDGALVLWAYERKERRRLMSSFGSSDGNPNFPELRTHRVMALCHDGAVVSAISVSHRDGAGSIVVTGGVDGTIKLWKWQEYKRPVSSGYVAKYTMPSVGGSGHTKLSHNLAAVSVINFCGAKTAVAKCLIPQGKVASVCMDEARDELVVALASGFIGSVNLSSSSVHEVVAGHILLSSMDSDPVKTSSIGETWTSVASMCDAQCGIWALEACPDGLQERFATAGDDGQVKVWVMNESRPLASVSLNDSVRALAWSPDAVVIAIGFGKPDPVTKGDGGSSKRSKGMRSGGFAVLNSDNLEVLFQGRDTVQPIRAISYAPSGRVMGLGTWGGRVLLYDSRQGYSLRWTVNISKLIKAPSTSAAKPIQNISKQANGLDLDAHMQPEDEKSEGGRAEGAGNRDAPIDREQDSGEGASVLSLDFSDDGQFVRASVRGGVCVVDTQLGKPRVGDRDLLGQVAWRTETASTAHAALTLTKLARVCVVECLSEQQKQRNIFAPSKTEGEKTSLMVGCDSDGRLHWWPRPAERIEEDDMHVLIGNGSDDLIEQTHSLDLVPGYVRACCTLGRDGATLAVASGNTVTLFRGSVST